MGATDLNKVAITMGKVIQLLKDIEPRCCNSWGTYNNKEDLYILAYMCRKGIIDRIQQNSYMYNPNIMIAIPLGLIRFKRVAMFNALQMTVGKVEQLASQDSEVERVVEDILDKGDFYYKIENLIPNDIIRTL